MTLVVLFAVYALLSAGGLVLFKLGGQGAGLRVDGGGLSLQVGWKLIAGVLCYLCSFLLWLYIVSRTQLTFALPLSVGIVNVLVFLGSAKFLGEQITPLKIAGLAVIVVGLFLLSAGQKGS